jgi:hypothetical protein
VGCQQYIAQLLILIKEHYRKLPERDAWAKSKKSKIMQNTWRLEKVLGIIDKNGTGKGTYRNVGSRPWRNR